MWLKLLLETVTGWVPWWEDCEKTCESWNGCWSIRKFPRDKEGGKNIVVIWNMCEDMRKAKMGQWPCQRRALCWTGSGPEWSARPQERAGENSMSLLLSLASFLLPGLRKLQGTQALYCQNTLLRDPHTNAPRAVLNSFPAYMETTSCVKTSDKSSLLCFTK